MAEARGPLVGRGRICPLLDSLTPRNERFAATGLGTGCDARHPASSRARTRSCWSGLGQDASPGLQALVSLDVSDPNACIDGQASACQPDHGVEVELSDFREVLTEP